MWPNQQETADLVTFTEETLNGNFFFVQWQLFKPASSCLLSFLKFFKDEMVYFGLPYKNTDTNNPVSRILQNRSHSQAQQNLVGSSKKKTLNT